MDFDISKQKEPKRYFNTTFEYVPYCNMILMISSSKPTRNRNIVVEPICRFSFSTK